MSASDPFQVDQPVALVDRFTVRPGCQTAAHALMVGDYAAHVADRLRCVGAWLSPPFEQPGKTSELTVVWEYASLGGLWGARMAEEDDPVARRIWAELDALTEARSRHVARAAPMALPPPDPRGRLPAATPDTIRTILFVHPREPITDPSAWIAAIEGLPARDESVVSSRAGPHDGYSFLPGDLTWDLASRGRIDPAACLAVLPGPAELVEAVELGEVLDAGLRLPNLAGTKRTILLRARAGTDADTLRAFEHTIADTPLYVTAIANWRLSRVRSSTGPVGWTHCLEQEVTDASVFVGDYLNHPYHWAVVERVFHPDAPERVGDGFLHTLYPIDHSVLSAV